MTLSNDADTFVEQHMLQAVVQLFVERGFADVSLEEIAARAGLGAVEVRRLFPRKQDFVIAAIQQTSRQYVEDLRDRLSGTDEEDVSRIVAEHVARNPFGTMKSIMTGNRGRF